MKKHRNLFNIPKGAYFLNHSVGCLPKSTEKKNHTFLNLWKKKGGLAWKEWLQAIDEFNHSLAVLLNANNTDFCPQVNISSAITKILGALPKQNNRKKILLSELDFPSVGFVLEQSKKMGYEVEFLQPTKNNLFTLEQWDKALTSDTQLAFITHVISSNSYQNPVAEITKIARSKNIFTIVDIAQSAGVIPIDLQQWSADFIVGTSIKWLCGGSGAAFLWVDSSNVENFLPTDVGWFSHETPFELDIHNFRYAKNALRFWGGTPSILPYILAATSINEITKIGIQNIYQHNQLLLDMLHNNLNTSELIICSPLSHNQRGGTFFIKHLNAENIIKKLAEKQIIIDHCQQFKMRISPHIYNTKAEILAIIRVLNSLCYG